MPSRPHSEANVSSAAAPDEKGQVPGPCRFLDQEPHRHDEALPDHRFAGPTQCLDHDSEARVLSHPFATDAKVGRMYSNFVEKQYFGSRTQATLPALPACVEPPIAQKDLLSTSFQSTGIAVHSTWTNHSTGKKLFDAITSRTSDVDIPEMAIKIPQRFFDYVMRNRSSLYSDLAIADKVSMMKERAQATSWGIWSLDRQLPSFFKDGKAGFHIQENLQVIDGWMQSATKGHWMPPKVMDLYNQALIAQNAAGLTAEERDIVLCHLREKAESLMQLSDDEQLALRVHATVSQTPLKKFEKVFAEKIEPVLERVIVGQQSLMRSKEWPMIYLPVEQKTDERPPGSKNQAATSRQATSDDEDQIGNVRASTK